MILSFSINFKKEINMKKMIVMLCVLVFSCTVFAKDKPSFDYKKTIPGKKWQLDLKLSKVKDPTFEYSFKQKFINHTAKGDIYRTQAYVQGMKFNKSKLIRIVQAPPKDKDYDYYAYDESRHYFIGKITMKKGKIYEKLSDDELTVYKIQDKNYRKGCLRYETKMECLKRTNPSKWLQLKQQQLSHGG